MMIPLGLAVPHPDPGPGRTTSVKKFGAFKVFPVSTMSCETYPAKMGKTKALLRWWVFVIIMWLNLYSHTLSGKSIIVNWLKLYDSVIFTWFFHTISWKLSSCKEWILMIARYLHCQSWIPCQTWKRMKLESFDAFSFWETSPSRSFCHPD